MPYKLNYHGGVYILGSDPVWIGNSEADDVVLYDINAAPNTALIVPYQQGYYIANHAWFSFFVNGDELTPSNSAQLDDGYEIRIGQSIITYYWEDVRFRDKVWDYLRRLGERIREEFTGG